MPNKWLSGNGITCPECKGHRIVPAPGFALIPCFTAGEPYATHARFGPNWKRCPTCKGDGRVPRSVEELIAEACA